MSKLSKQEFRMREALAERGIYHICGDALTSLTARANDGKWFGATLADYDHIARQVHMSDETRKSFVLVDSPYDWDRKHALMIERKRKGN